MTRRIKFIAILLCVVTVALIASSVGATAALWTSGGGTDGDSMTLGVTTDFWNVLAEHFQCDPDGVLTGFTASPEYSQDAAAWLNLGELVIPAQVGGNSVRVVGSGVFASAVMKEMAVTLAIPRGIQCIEIGAFSGFVNLQKVVFEEGTADAPLSCRVEEFAFAGAASLSEVYIGAHALSELSAQLDGDELVYRVGAYSVLRLSANAFYGSSYSPALPE